jgi:hypothetical protein
LPSASSVERLALCPGSWKMSRGLPELTNPDLQEWAASGDRIHAWLAEQPVTLEPEEMDIAQRCIRQRNELVHHYLTLATTITREQRLWLCHPGTSRHRFSGKVDWAGYCEENKTALVIDYKTNRGDTTASASNLQLRSGAVLFWQSLEAAGYQVANIAVAIIQPLTGKPEICEYKPLDLLASETQLHFILDTAEKPDARLVAGDRQCKYCPARITCPAALDKMKDLQLFPALRTQNLPVTGERLAALLEACTVADLISKTVKAHAKKILAEAPDAIPGYSLAPGDEAGSVVDPMGACDALCQAGIMDRDYFLHNIIKVGLGDLVAGIAEHNNFPDREARKAMDSHCRPFILKKRKSPTIAKHP